MKKISILGSGWLGLPLAKHLVKMGYQVKASTRSKSKITELLSNKIDPFIVNLEKLPTNINDFLKSNILIINIPSKNCDGFTRLIHEIVKSEVTKVLFISSTSVYKTENKTVYEVKDDELHEHPLLTIESLFQQNSKFNTTIIRFGGLIGYSRNPAKFFKGRAIQQPNAPINLIHRDDCIGIIDRIIHKNVWGETFNGCADTHPIKREFYTKVTTQSGLPIPELIESTTELFKIVSNAKVKNFLGYEFIYPDVMKIDFQ